MFGMSRTWRSACTANSLRCTWLVFIIGAIGRVAVSRAQRGLGGRSRHLRCAARAAPGKADYRDRVQHRVSRGSLSGQASSVSGVILVTPFDSLVELARDTFPGCPVRLLLRHRMSTLDSSRTSRLRRL
jgi:hypothetical protein